MSRIYLFKNIFFGLFFSLLRTSLWNLEDPVLRKMIRQVRLITDTQLLYCTVLRCGSFRGGERLILFSGASLWHVCVCGSVYSYVQSPYSCINACGHSAVIITSLQMALAHILLTQGQHGLFPADSQS